jgi:uncharacterized protein YukE
MITDGLPADQAAIVKAAIERDAVKTKASTIKAQNEWQSIEQQRAALQDAMEGGPNRPGAKAYQQWYNDNYNKVVELQANLQKYQEKYGPNPDASNPPNPGGRTMTPEEIQAEVDKRIRDQYAPLWSNTLTQTGTVVQKHLMAGRKTPIPMSDLGKLASERFNGNLEQAYDEWDKPEREKAFKADQEAEVERRVQERLQQHGAGPSFPGGADMTPSTLGIRTKTDMDKFDPAALKQDLAKTFIEAGKVS